MGPSRVGGILWVMLLGALDLGSNSFHLLVARVGRRGELEKVAGQKSMLRLEEAVAATGRIPPETFERALAAVGELAAAARRRGATRVVAAGTSALRDADNGGHFAEVASLRYGIDVEILSGEDEGRLVYDGARFRAGELPERVGVLDLGGGSAEIAIGDGHECRFAHSLPLGFLRLARNLDAHGALDDDGFARLTDHVLRTAASIRATARELAPRAWLLSGGTARALGRVLGREPGAVVSTRALVRLAEGFARSEPSRLVGLGVDPARARGFGLGSSVLALLSEELGAHAVRVTPGGLREGLLLRAIGGRSTRHARVHLHDAGRVARPPAG
jgi:exopolyphosphatase/guanosine-5'-triphosphate,3'-diphosphate pyrophosphatase